MGANSEQFYGNQSVTHLPRPPITIVVALTRGSWQYCEGASPRLHRVNAWNGPGRLGVVGRDVTETE